MKKFSFVAVAVMVAVVVLVASEAQMAEAATCNPTELSPCLSSMTSGSPPSAACCSKLKEQKPCLCGYLKNPNMKQYVNSPTARKVVSSCGVPYPQC
ncbi:hypothetical protein SLE2022_275400 [Rubroshorea leprosula]|uniref:Bifunctional inhibitor/plant lipid transfer protein/seed storage helical domain-containing protein n=1 Tax=Rubroshorea leprosula TaxID=152421 RepID=A0AAV5IES4_9ROSI|nr:hypothetical protein SLEP1_g10746 [Rubroshorea leprosula]